jgi:pimeloyl-ACP methyl ester carboxylesterase
MRRDEHGDEYRIVVDSERLRITEYPGTSGVHVVSFTGIGFQMGGIQTEEFRRSLSGADRRHTVTYVIDKTKSWFNTTGQEIVDTLLERTAPAGRVVTLGNSMGGFGAVLFAGLLPRCDRTIAFAPQFAVSPARMPEREYRWPALRAAITEHRFEHALAHHVPGGRYQVFCGASSGLDRLHADLFKAHGSGAAEVFLIERGRHAVVADLKASGCLHALLDLMIEDPQAGAAEILDLLARHGVQASAG